jgi:hypothetical protein
MESILFKGIKIYYDANWKPFVETCRRTFEKGIPLIQDMWGLKVPRNCIFILRCSKGDIRAGWTCNIFPLVVINLPLPISPFDKLIGNELLKSEITLEKKIEVIIIHELVHVCSMHLRDWRHEGIALYTQDVFMGHQTIRETTINIIDQYKGNRKAPPTRDFISLSKDEAIYHYSHVYWLTKYLESEYPGFLKKHSSDYQIDNKIRKKLNITGGDYWMKIDKMLVNRF